MPYPALVGGGVINRLGWDTVQEIDKAYLKARYRSVRLKNVRYLAIDEVYLGRKRKFITIAMDLESGHVIPVGKGKEASKGLWKRLKRHNAKMRIVGAIEPKYRHFCVFQIADGIP